MRRGPELTPGLSLGHLYEKNVLGNFFSRDERKYNNALAREKNRLQQEGERFLKSDGFKLVREHYGGDPTNPKQQIAQDIRLAVIDGLGLETDEEMDNVRFFTAIGTPLDEYHGIDAWIEYKTSQDEIFVVTIDVTLNQEKLNIGHKADILIGQLADVTNQEDEYLEQIDSYADEIVGKMKKEISRLELQKNRKRAI